MSETTKQRTERIMGMSHGQLIMHCQDLTRQRDLVVDALKQILADDYENDFLSFDLFDVCNKAIFTIKESEEN